jgi:uncharacterized membrane protein
MADMTSRLDAFSDAAFAFAVTLMVVGTGGAAPSFADLVTVARGAPSFVIGFAIIAMFWLAHVRWRQLRGEGDWRGVVLTLALVFTVLLYVHPLRAMAASFAGFLGGAPDSYGGRIADMFALYGVGFVAMSGIVMLLFFDVRRADVGGQSRREATGQAVIWSIAAVTGLIAVLLTRIPAISVWAPFAYATLPFSIGIFAVRYRWTEPDSTQGS